MLPGSGWDRVKKAPWWEGIKEVNIEAWDANVDVD